MSRYRDFGDKPVSGHLALGPLAHFPSHPKRGGFLIVTGERVGVFYKASL